MKKKQNVGYKETKEYYEPIKIPSINDINKYHYVLDILVTCETIIKHNQDNLHLNSFII